MLLISLIAGLVMPRFSKIYQNSVIGYEKDDMVTQLSTYGYTAFQNQQYYQLSHDDHPLLVLKEGWAIKIDTPIHYYANGVCSGGEMMLSKENKEYHIVLTAPFCQAILKNIT
jgi:general secretion pathway protein G